MTTSRYVTAQTILDQTAIECGLDAPGTSVYSSSDKNVILLRNLLNSAGQELALMYPWSTLIKEHTITVVNPGDSGTYTLPADFNGLVPQSGWDRTNDYPLGGSLTSQVWQYYQAVNTTPVWIEFRLQADTFKTLPAPPNNGTVIAFEYLSRYWVKPSGQSSPTAATATAYTDTIYFEPVLICALLKLRYKEARGEDTTAALVAFERRFDLSVAPTEDAPLLDMAGPQSAFRYLSDENVPDTGIG